jgi:N-acetylglutamate synthase-like GNAT family acetyltransferase
LSAVVVSPYAPADREKVVDLVLGIQRNEFGVPITLADQPDLADVAGHYQQRRGGFWVAKDEARVVGTIGLLDGGGAVALRKMFVHEDHRGKDRGTAALLLAALLAHARGQGVDFVHLGTRPEMRAAHRFYEKHGFARVEAASLPPSFPRMTFDSIFYRLAL